MNNRINIFLSLLRYALLFFHNLWFKTLSKICNPCVHAGMSKISISLQHFAMELRLENISSSEALFGLYYIQKPFKFREKKQIITIKTSH